MLQVSLERDREASMPKIHTISFDDCSIDNEVVEAPTSHNLFYHEWIKLLPESAQPPPNCILFQNTSWREIKDSLPLPRFSFDESN